MLATSVVFALPPFSLMNAIRRGMASPHAEARRAEARSGRFPESPAGDGRTETWRSTALQREPTTPLSNHLRQGPVRVNGEHETSVIL